MDDRTSTQLSSGWLAAVADEERRRHSTDVDLDTSSWTTVAVPGHWRDDPEFAASDGPLLYRHRFESPTPVSMTADRWWLVFNGVHQQGDVWLDGTYVGDIEGSFVPHDFEITDQLADRAEHVLSVEVSSTPTDDRRRKRGVTGTLQDSEFVPPGWNPGGIWAPVELEHSGPMRLRFCRVVCVDADEASATLAMRAVIDAAEVCEVDLHTVIGRTSTDDVVLDHRLVQPLAAGENRVEWTVTVANPELWWPHALGDQPLYDVHLGVETTDGLVSDTHQVRTGFRTVSQSKWITSINGERLFLKGACLGPQRPAFGQLIADDHRRDIGLALDAGLDLIRLTGHVARSEFYDEADKAGMLVWQDFPLHRGHARSVRSQAVRQAREAVDLLGHHPSVMLWCAHDEPDGRPLTERSTTARQVGDVALQATPTWTKTVLDRSVRRAIEQNDSSRPVISHSGVLPSPPRFDGAPSHLFLGWDHHAVLDLGPLVAKLPRFAMFVSQFGAQAPPTPDANGGLPSWAYATSDTDWHLDWETLERAGVHREAFERFVPPGRHDRYDDWARAAQRYQAELVRHVIETLRRLKYRPAGGFTVLGLIDGFDTVGYGMVDHQRTPKSAFESLRRACAPVLVAADRFPPNPHPGDIVTADVHLVNDHRQAVEGIVTATIDDPAGPREWRWQGRAGADSCVRIGSIETVVPRAKSDGEGVLSLKLTVETPDGEVIASNRYDTRFGRDA